MASKRYCEMCDEFFYGGHDCPRCGARLRPLPKSKDPKPKGTDVQKPVQ